MTPPLLSLGKAKSTACLLGDAFLFSARHSTDGVHGEKTPQVLFGAVALSADVAGVG